MSDNADFSLWSNDEIELLDNIKKEIKLDNSGSDTDSSKMNRSKKEVWKVLEKEDTEKDSDEENASHGGKSPHSGGCVNRQSNISLGKLKSHFSSNDLSNLNPENVSQNESVPKTVTPFTHSSSYNCLSNNEKPVSKKYDHVQSKIKQYFNANAPVGDNTPKEEGANRISKAGKFNSRDYLEEINLRLTRELDEKNALISKLQENYENLLLKYAEAQNKIDHLRFRSVCESTECQVHSSGRGRVGSPARMLPSGREEGKGRQDPAAPPARNDSRGDLEKRKVDRPCSLPLGPEALARDAMKVGTPTDSEGVSSVITSMSGHSKILNSLDVHGPNCRDFNMTKYSERNYKLSDNAIVHDAFNKVKNWQNSLPPLEYIETPETTLYDEPPVQVSPSANSPKENGAEGVEDHEGVFPSDCNANSEPSQKENGKGPPRPGSDGSMRALSLPSAFTKKSLSTFKQRKNAGNGQYLREVPSYITKKRKKPQLLRCSSLPTCDTPRSSRRNIHIPPLDLDNLTLSDVDSSQVEYYDYDKTNLGTSSSYLTSQSGSMEFPSQTCRSNSRERTAEYSDSPFSGRPSFNKSTSITPDRCNDAFPSFLKSNSFCRICGEKLEDRSFPCRSTSYQTFLDMKDAAAKASEKRGRYPFSRSVSFNSETSSFRRCFHSQDCLFRRTKEDSLEKLDKYTNNLRARSQVVMKALAAHVNNA